MNFEIRIISEWGGSDMSDPILWFLYLACFCQFLPWTCFVHLAHITENYCLIVLHQKHKLHIEDENILV